MIVLLDFCGIYGFRTFHLCLRKGAFISKRVNNFKLPSVLSGVKIIYIVFETVIVFKSLKNVFGFSFVAFQTIPNKSGTI